MKKIFKTTFALALGVLALASCSDDYEYTAPEATHEGSAVAFVEGSSQSVVLGIDEANPTVSVAIVREDGTNAEDIPVEVTSLNPDLFTVPATAHFDAGQTETTIDVAVDAAKMEAFTNYTAKLHLVSNVYAADNSGLFELTVTKEDYVQVGTGTYTSQFFGASWESPLKYSATLDQYRITDWISEGYPLEFTWNRETGECTMASKQTSGYVHPSYGMITAYAIAITADGQTVVFEDNTFYFGFNWRVSAGSFGSTMETFTITELNQ